jgi:addiction module RelE/StbE family toxin
MKIRYDKKFKQQYKKLPQKMQEQFDERLRLFLVNEKDPLLRLHPLRGKFGGYYSINVSGDLRALFYREGDEVVIFALIGTHSQLYG